MTIGLRVEPEGMVLESPFNRQFVNDLKTKIPVASRMWDNTRKAWVFAPDAFTTLAALVKFHFGVALMQPMNLFNPDPVTKILELEYLGRCKDRDDGTSSAMGRTMNKEWRIIMPEDVLRKWFGGVVRPGATTTLYGTLGLKEDALSADIKSAYRRLVRQWHPDVCHEIDAAEQFRKIQHAYEMLMDGTTRKKYDAGLKLTASLTPPPPPKGAYDPLKDDGYRAPLKCGYVLVNCIEKLGRFSVAEIMQWQDIVDGRGRTLSTSWNRITNDVDRFWS
jgi:hypothetical protein